MDARTRTLPHAAALTCGIALALGFVHDALPAALVEAVRAAEDATIQRLLRDRDAVREAAADGSTALHWAAYLGNETLVRDLVNAGADVNSVNRYGATPLSHAATNPTGDVAHLLLEAGADPDSSIGQGETALMTAARSGNEAAVAALIAAGADANARETRRGQTALMWAAAKGHTGIMRRLLAAGAEVNAQELPVNRDLGRVVQAGGGRLPAGGMSSLLFAAREGQLEAARILLDAGAQIDQAEGDGWTPLLLAIVNTHYTLAAELAARGASLGLANTQGLLPLYAAVEMRLPDITARPLRPERDPMSSLELIERLLDLGADPNGRISSRLQSRGPGAGLGPTQAAGVGAGGTAFMRATRGGDLEVMQLLLARGADPALTREDGTNAMMIAAGVGAPGFGATPQTRGPEALKTAIELCQNAGLDIDALNADGTSALHGAAASGNLVMIQVLATAGADLGLRNRQGLTALEVAEGKGPPVRGREPTPQPEAATALRALMEHGARVAGRTETS